MFLFFIFFLIDSSVCRFFSQFSKSFFAYRFKLVTVLRSSRARKACLLNFLKPTASLLDFDSFLLQFLINRNELFAVLGAIDSTYSYEILYRGIVGIALFFVIVIPLLTCI